MDQPVNTITFKPDRTHLLAAALMAGIMLLVVSAKPLLLGWILLVPLGFVYWVLRSTTRVDDTGITASNAFGKQTHIPWEKIEGIGFKRAQAYVQTTYGTTISLPGVSFNHLPQLEQASTGRIPDALTRGREAADNKVVIVHKDGHQFLMSKEEYEAHRAPEKHEASADTHSGDPDSAESTDGSDSQE